MKQLLAIEVRNLDQLERALPDDARLAHVGPGLPLLDRTDRLRGLPELVPGTACAECRDLQRHALDQPAHEPFEGGDVEGRVLEVVGDVAGEGPGQR